MPMKANLPFDGNQGVQEKLRLLTMSRACTLEPLDAITSERGPSSARARVSRELFTSGDQKKEDCGRDGYKWVNSEGMQAAFPLTEYLPIKKEVAPVNVNCPISKGIQDFTPFITCKSEVANEHGEAKHFHRNMDSTNHRGEMNDIETWKVEDLRCHVVRRVVDTSTNYVESNCLVKKNEKLSTTRREQSTGVRSDHDSCVDIQRTERRRRRFSSGHDETIRASKLVLTKRWRSYDSIWSAWNGMPDIRLKWTVPGAELDGLLTTVAPRCDMSPCGDGSDHVTSPFDMPKLKKEPELWSQSTDHCDVTWERGAQSPNLYDDGHSKGSHCPLTYVTPPQDIGRNLTTWSGDLGDSAFQGQHCVVCGEVANGNFFGAVVCLPCKSFFIRCTKDGEPCILQQCHGQCDIKKQLRNRCQYCRYQQCLAVGMSRREKPECIQPQDGQELCRVCGDLANGIHFGVYTCEGCKKFFRRGMKEHTTYVCKDEKSCRLNPRNRNNCRYCRYQKCLTMGMSREAIKMGRPRKLYPSRPMDDVMSTTNQHPGMFPSYNSNCTRSHGNQLSVTDHQKIPIRDHCDRLTNTLGNDLWKTKDMKRPEFPVNSLSSSYMNRSYSRVPPYHTQPPQSHNTLLQVPMPRMGEFNDLDPRTDNQRPTMLNHIHQARGLLNNSVPKTLMPHHRLPLLPHQNTSHPAIVPFNGMPPQNRGTNNSGLYLNHERLGSQHHLSFEAQHKFGRSTRNGLTVNNMADKVAFKNSTNHHMAYNPRPHLGPEVVNNEWQRMPKLVQMSPDMASFDQRPAPRGGHCDARTTNKPLSSASFSPIPPSTRRSHQRLNRSQSPHIESKAPHYESASAECSDCEPSVLDLRINAKSRHSEAHQSSDSSDYIVNEILKSTSGYVSYTALKRTHVSAEETQQQIYPFKIPKLENRSQSPTVHSAKRSCDKIGHNSNHLVPPGSSHVDACTGGQYDKMVIIKSDIVDDQSQPLARTTTNDAAVLSQTLAFHQAIDHSKNNPSLLPSGRYTHTKESTPHCPNQQEPHTYCIYPLTTCMTSDPSYISNQIMTSYVQSSNTPTQATIKSTELSKSTTGLSTSATGLSQPTTGLAQPLIPLATPPNSPLPRFDGTQQNVNHPKNIDGVQASSCSSCSNVSQQNQGSDPPPREQQSSHDRFDPYTNEQTLVYINEMFLVVDTLTDTSLSSSQNLLKGKSTSELDAIDNMFTNIYGYSPLKVNHFWRSLFSYMPRGNTERWQGVLTSRQEEWLKDITNNYANQVLACDEELNPPTVDTNKCEVWPARGEDTDHWKHFQERVARQTYVEAQFVLHLPDIEGIHPKDRIKLGNNTRLFGNTILMASKEWFDPVRKKFKFFWNWKLPQDHPLCPFRNRIIKTGSRIFNLHMDRTEVALLSALNIMSPENATFQNLPRIWDYTHTLMKILGHYLSTINVDPDDRIPELLSVMPKVRHMSMWYSNLIRNMRADPSSMDKTLQDLTRTAAKLSTTDCSISTTICNSSC